MISIVGDGIIPEAKAFYDVRDSLSFDDDVYLAAMWSPLCGIELKDVAIYNMEPLYDGCRSLSIGYMETLKRCHVIDYSANNVEYLKHHGIEAFHMPYGYHPSLERGKEVEKDIEVLCVGSINPRREHIFKWIEKEFNFVWSQGVYGEELDKLIRRAKAHINVHYYDGHPLEVVRLNYLMANHCNIVSEYGDDENVNIQYKDGLTFVDYKDLIYGCRQALDHPKDGYECIKKVKHDCLTAQEWLRGR